MKKKLTGTLIFSLFTIYCNVDGGANPSPVDSGVGPSGPQQGDASPFVAADADASGQSQNGGDGGVGPTTGSRDASASDSGGINDARFTDAITASDGHINQPVDAMTNPAETSVSDSSATPASCDRACLQRFLDGYIEALVARDASRLELAQNLRATENAEVVVPGDGIWQSVTALRSFREDFIDVVEGQAGCFVVLEENASPTLMVLRLKVVGHQIAEIESIVTRAGEAIFFAPQSLVAAEPIFDEIVPEAQRVTRQELEDLANAYFDGLVSGNGSSLRFDPQCRRLENGVQTASGAGIGNTFFVFSYIDEIKRRVLIRDEERGLVFAIAMFEVRSQGRSTFVSELFKIVDGSFRLIDAFLLNMPYGTLSGW
ncbi:MAG: hypothetical protein JXA30_10695 [Deltaproteobacteria bacterium]|nr:hypothetical protein [Deltaproteobacteria bacterium]